MKQEFEKDGKRLSDSSYSTYKNELFVRNGVFENIPNKAEFKINKEKFAKLKKPDGE